MASFTVAAGDVAKHAFTLTASTVDTVTFTDNVGDVEVVSDGAAAVYYTNDGSTPTVGGANTYVLPAGLVSVDRRGTRSSNVLKFISAGTPLLSVQRG